MELLLFISAARRASASSICAVIPYYGYGRITELGVMHNCLTGADVAEMLQAAGVNSIISIDLFREQLQGFFMPQVTVDSIPVMHLLAAYLMETDTLDSPIVVAANAHNVYRAKAFRESLDKLKCPSTYATVKNSHEIVGDVAGKDAILIDNYSLTGDTLCREAKTLKEQGAKKITVVVTHGLFDEEAVKHINEAPIDRVISTNTVPACEAEKVGVWIEGDG